MLVTVDEHPQGDELPGAVGEALAVPVGDLEDQETASAVSCTTRLTRSGANPFELDGVTAAAVSTGRVAGGIAANNIKYLS